MENYEYSGTCLLGTDEPVSTDEGLEQACWKDAMQAELKAIKENNTWSLTELPKGAKAIRVKWVFKVKKDAVGQIIRHKARMVAKGYAQRAMPDQWQGSLLASAGSPG